jgi:hypothetical protein
MILCDGKPLQTLSFEDVKKEVMSRELTEGWFVDWKKDFPKDFGKHVASFANTYGGYLFIGVVEDEATKKAQDFPGIPSASDPLGQVRHFIRDTVDPFPYFQKATVQVPNTENVIVIVHIPESTFPPHVYKDGRIYIRQADGSDPVPLTDRYSLDRLYAKQERNREELRGRLQQSILCKHVLPKLGPWDEPKEAIRVHLLIYPTHRGAFLEPDFFQDQHWKESVADCIPHPASPRYTQDGLALIAYPTKLSTGAEWWKEQRFTVISEDGLYESCDIIRLDGRSEFYYLCWIMEPIANTCDKAALFYRKLGYEGPLRMEVHCLGTYARVLRLGRSGGTHACDTGHISVEKELGIAELSPDSAELVKTIEQELIRSAGGLQPIPVG